MQSSKQSVDRLQTAILSEEGAIEIVPTCTMVPSGGMILTLGNFNLFLDTTNAMALSDFIAECVMRENFLDRANEDVREWH